MASSQETRDAIQFWLFVLLIALGCVFAGRAITQFNPTYVLVAVVGLFVALISFLSPKVGLAIVVFSMIFSPKVMGGSIGDVRRHGAAVFKLNDFLLIVISLAWMARTAVFKGKAFLVRTPLNLPVFVYGLVFVIATLVSIVRGNLYGPMRSMFYVIKYLEYLLMFFMTVNVVDSRDDVHRYVRYGLMTALLVTVVAYTQVPTGQRVTAPFDIPINAGDDYARTSESNTFGGYYLVVFGLLLGHYTQSLGPAATASIASLLFMLTPFLLTQSRSSYLGFAAALLFHIVSTRKRQLALLFGLGLGVLLVMTTPRLRDTVTKRVESTFVAESLGSGTVALGGSKVAIEGSTMARVLNWKWIFAEKFPERPLLGFGVTGVGLCDAWYPLLVGETGLVGFCAFFWVVARIWSCSWGLYRASLRAEDRSLALGLLTALVALLVHGVGANTFIIVRIMEPFWFLTALLARLYVDEISSKNPAAA